MAVADALTELDPEIRITARWAPSVAWRPGWSPSGGMTSSSSPWCRCRVNLRRPAAALLRVRTAVRQTRSVFDTVGGRG